MKEKNITIARPVLAGVFTGIIAAVANLVYDYIYRKTTGYDHADLINAYTIIFFSILVLMMAGIIYFLLARFINTGKLLFIIVFAGLTILSLFLNPLVVSERTQHIMAESEGLTRGLLIITGCLGAFLLPYFTNHPRIWS